MRWYAQFLRFGFVGVASNLIGYVLYIVLTNAGTGHKTAMTILFAIGTFQTFFFNKCWTFGYEGFFHSSLAKYVLAYGLSYLLNLFSLMLFVDHLGLPHQVIQGVMILSLALMLFLLQKYWVFRAPPPAMTQG